MRAAGEGEDSRAGRGGNRGQDSRNNLLHRQSLQSLMKLQAIPPIVAANSFTLVSEAVALLSSGYPGRQVLDVMVTAC
jgi:hypothetical protein